MVLKHKTVLEFTISSGKLFHLIIVLTQKVLILNVFRALGFFSFFFNYHGFGCLITRIVLSWKSHIYFAQLLRLVSYPYDFFYTSKLTEIAFLIVLHNKDFITEVVS